MDSWYWKTHGIDSDSWYIIGTPESHTYERAECYPYAGFFLKHYTIYDIFFNLLDPFVTTYPNRLIKDNSVCTLRAPEQALLSLKSYLCFRGCIGYRKVKLVCISPGVLFSVYFCRYILYCVQSSVSLSVHTRLPKSLASTLSSSKILVTANFTGLKKKISYPKFQLGSLSGGWEIK